MRNSILNYLLLFTLGCLVLLSGCDSSQPGPLNASGDDGTVIRNDSGERPTPNDTDYAEDLDQSLDLADSAREMNDIVTPDSDDAGITDSTSTEDLGEDLETSEEDLGDLSIEDAVPEMDTGPEYIEGAGIYETSDDFFLAELCPDELLVDFDCLPETDEGELYLCEGLDNDCDGIVDENCPCKLGEVQPCFLGPPGSRDVGACADGAQLCISSEVMDIWGPCEGGISPSDELCDGMDNDCDGCTDEIIDCEPDGTCPEPGDPRVPDGTPFSAYSLNGGDFYWGEDEATALSWRWSIDGGPCDSISGGTPSFTLMGANSQNAVFTPTLSGNYTVTMTVTTAEGTFECIWIVHIAGPGLRIEMCYPESWTQDLDLFLMGPGFEVPWHRTTTDSYSPAPEACSWANCEATIRGAGYSRVNWGYSTSDLSECDGGPQGPQWTSLGYCANPRLDIDNNLSEGIGMPENINVDRPVDGDSFRIMVQNFSGGNSHPLVNIYCDGNRLATYGASPDSVSGFMGTAGYFGLGAMWRVADVLAITDDLGDTVDCLITPVHPPGETSGYHITYNDPSF